MNGVLGFWTGHWGALATFAAVIFVAALVHRYAPQKKRRTRRITFIFAFYILAWGLTTLFGSMEMARAAEWLSVTTQLFGAFTLVTWLAIVLFDLALPAVGVDVVAITTDIVVGVAYVLAMLGVLRAADVNLAGLIATSAVVSAVLALSLQATLGNILGGVALQLDGSIHVGDWVQVDATRQGRVKEIRWRHTVVETRDADTIIVPNASLLASNIFIYGKKDGLPSPRRMSISFFVDFRYAPSRVISVVTEALGSAPIARVAASPAPDVVCMDLGRDQAESCARYVARYWLTDFAVDDPTNSIVRSRIYAALRRAKIPLARPAQTLFLTPEDDTSEQKRSERHFEKRLAAIESIELFKELTPEELRLLADRLHYAPFTAGEIVTKQGAVAHYLYVITEGSVEVRTHVEGASKPVSTLEAPAFFGEMGLMTGEPRLADVIALEDIECFRLEKEALQRVLGERPEVAEEMSRTLAKRRIELIAIRENLTAQDKGEREERERERILGRIRSFFGLG